MATHEHAQTLEVGSTPAEVRDPVCGMTFPPETAAGTVERGGQTYYFCNPGCVEKVQGRSEEVSFTGQSRQACG